MREIPRFTTAKNSNGQLIASRNGRLICSPRDPEREAQAWLEKQKLTAQDRRVIVLGAGICHHINAIAKKFPDIKIEALELDRETFNFLVSKEKDSVLTALHASANTLQNNSYDAVLSFRPAWTGYEKEYLNIYFELTQREAISEVSFKLKGAEFEKQLPLTDDDKIWKTLRELIG